MLLVGATTTLPALEIGSVQRCTDGETVPVSWSTRPRESVTATSNVAPEPCVVTTLANAVADVVDPTTPATVATALATVAPVPAVDVNVGLSLDQPCANTAPELVSVLRPVVVAPSVHVGVPAVGTTELGTVYAKLASTGDPTCVPP